MRSYEILPPNPFCAAVSGMVDFEVWPGRTVTFLAEVDCSELERLRGEAEVRGLRRPSYTALVVKAAALALREFPYANRRVLPFPWRGRLQRFLAIDAAVAFECDTPGAEMAAGMDVLRDADERTLPEITAWLDRLPGNAGGGPRPWKDFHALIARLPRMLLPLVLRLPVYFPSLWVKYRGGVFLVSAPSKYGVDIVAATWFWPLGFSFGFVKERPVCRGGMVRVCPTTMLTLNFDRRVMAGAQAARFFRRVVEILEKAGCEMAAGLPAGAAEESAWAMCGPGS